MRKLGVNSAGMWALYGLLVVGLLYSAIGGTESVYAYDPCNAAECAAFNNNANYVCTQTGHGGAAYVSCPDNPPDTAIIYCNDGYAVPLICRD